NDEARHHSSTPTRDRSVLIPTPCELLSIGRPLPSLARGQQDPGGEEAVPAGRALRLLAGRGAAEFLRQVRGLRLVSDAVAVVVDLLVLGRQLLGAGV